jgi:hypothetical protein
MVGTGIINVMSVIDKFLRSIYELMSIVPCICPWCLYSEMDRLNAGYEPFLLAKENSTSLLFPSVLFPLL